MAGALPEIDAIDRDRLQDSRGRAYKEFKRTLTPRWARVWLDIGAGYLGIACTMAALVALERLPVWWAPLWVVLGALALGYFIAFIELFLHEAAHFNVAPGRMLNDWLSNLFVGLLIGHEVGIYRPLHFDHHRYLGTTRDTERSYFAPLNAGFILEGLLGIRVLSMLLRGAAPAQAQANDVRQSAAIRVRRLAMLAAGAALNVGVIGVAFWHRHFTIALAWPIGIACVYPVVTALRQLTEHRSFEARADVDYAKTPHGSVTRMFEPGPLASTLGGAGFSRHLLHHWEPQISYTRLGELEAFLLDTPAAPVLRAQTTTYARAITRLFGAT
jgi:fatty acid desaturase